MSDRSKIEWCDASWNPITGCKHDCAYCYARRMAARFGGFDGYGCEEDHERVEWTGKYELQMPAYIKRGTEQKMVKAPFPFKFEPTLHRYRLDEPQHWKKPRNIFVGSMADIFGAWVEDAWIEEVFAACEKAPKHRFLFLTKNPARYIALAQAGKLPKNDNMWFGTTATTPDQQFFWGGAWHTFVSIEPILWDYSGEISGMCDTFAQWVIIGAETGNRKGKVVPEMDWIRAIVNECNMSSIALFMKDSLIPIVGEEYMIREFPWDMNSFRARSTANLEAFKRWGGRYSREG